MSIFAFSHMANPNACSANALYITRDDACQGIAFHNLDELEGANRLDTKSNVIAYAEMREAVEAGSRKNFKPKFDKNGKDITPKSRNHFRAVFSWDRKEDSAEALRQAQEFLRKEMPGCKAILSVHQNTDNTHIHVWFDCRGLDNKKLQIEKRRFKTMDERWTRSFDREYGTDYLPAYKALKKETAEWKRAYGEAVEAGREPPPKPPRFTDFYKDYKTRELQNYGIEQTRLGTDQRDVADRQTAVEISKRSFEQSKLALRERANSSERADRAAGETVRAVDECLTRSNRLPTQARTRSVVERDDDGRGR
jgi:hypothetical protein